MNPAPRDAVEKGLGALSILCLFLAVLSLCTFEILSVDFGWHIKTGELIWATRSIPTHDVYSYIAEGSPWVDSHWLFQLMIFLIHAVAGIPGLYVMRGVLLVATFSLLLSTNRPMRYLPISLFLCVLTLLISHQRFVMRPELVSLFFVAAYFYCMENFAGRELRFAVVIPLCQVIWANMHGLSIVGIAFLVLYVAGDALQLGLTRLNWKLSDAHPSASELRSKLAVLGLSILAYLANANGVDGILYPFKLFGELRGEVASYPTLEELDSPFSVAVAFPLDPIAIYKLFIVVSAVSWIGSWRRVRLAHVLIYAAFFYLSMMATRNMSLFAVVGTPIAIRNLDGILDRVFARERANVVTRRAIAAVTTAAMLVLAAVSWRAAASNAFYERLGWPRTFGVGISDRFAGDVLERLEALEGRFFNSPDLGGYLIWKLYPKKQVAIDGRWEVYGDRLPELQRVYSSREAFERLAEEYDITAIVLSTRTSLARKMSRWVRRSREWHLTARSKNVQLFERRERLDRQGKARIGLHDEAFASP